MGGGLLILSDLFAQTDFRLFVCLRHSPVAAEYPHFQSIVQQAFSKKNLFRRTERSGRAVSSPAFTKQVLKRIARDLHANIHERKRLRQAPTSSTVSTISTCLASTVSTAGQSSSENSSTYRLSGLASGLRYPQLQSKPLFEDGGRYEPRSKTNEYMLDQSSSGTNACSRRQERGRTGV
jgi:hypothetical protein